MLDSFGKDTIADRIDTVINELSLGIQWNHPILVFLIYRSEKIKDQVQENLFEYIDEAGKPKVFYTVDKTHFDIPIDILNYPKHDQAVFFISGLKWGGGRGYSNAYRALNMHREYFIEGNIKAIFWLTINEARQLSRFSPDFWSFRHKVVEFSDLPVTQYDLKPRSSEYLLHNLYSNSTNEFLDLINTAERLNFFGCFDEAILSFRTALRKYPEERAINLQIAEIYLSMGRKSEAVRILKKVKQGINGMVSLKDEFTRLNLVASSSPGNCGGLLERSG